MKERNSYSRIIQELEAWHDLSKGLKIQLFHHCIEKDITSFMVNFSSASTYTHGLGVAFSESGLSRDEIQFIAVLEKRISKEDLIVERVEEILNILDTDYLDLLFLDFEAPAEDVISALQRLRVRGKISEVGVLENKPGEKSDLLKDFPANASLSTFHFTPAAVKTLTLAEAGSEKMTQMIIPESGNWQNEHEVLKKVANRYNLLPKELLFAWLLHLPAHFHPVIKGNSEAVIDSAVKAFHTSIIEEDLEKLPERL